MADDLFQPESEQEHQEAGEELELRQEKLDTAIENLVAAIEELPADPLPDINSPPEFDTLRPMPDKAA